MQPYRKPLPSLDEEEIAEFWSLVDASGGPDACWPWLDKRHARGYGNFKVKGKVYRANRIALFLATGEDPGHQGSCRGESHALSKLTEISVLEIRALFVSGITKAELARKFNVSHKLIRCVIARTVWKHI